MRGHDSGGAWRLWPAKRAPATQPETNGSNMSPALRKETPLDFGGRLRKEDWTVREVSRAMALPLIEEHHYARGAANTATYLHGLFRVESDALEGAAWWIPPTKGAALASYPENWKGVLALSRLVVAPGVPKNAATFLLARSVKLIDKDRWPCLVTYADEWRGHTGGIYRASNWVYLGKTKPERTYVLNDRMISRKAGPKTRTHDQMINMGAVMVGSFSKHKYVFIKKNK